LWSYGSWIHNYLCSQCLSPQKLWVRIPHGRGVLDTTLCDEVCQWLATGLFSLGTPVSSTNKTDCHDIMEIKLVTFTGACANEIIPSINRLFVYKAKEGSHVRIFDLSRWRLYVTLFSFLFLGKKKVKTFGMMKYLKNHIKDAKDIASWYRYLEVWCNVHTFY
jgi:hypothetical protein